MICQKCHEREASVHVTRVVNGEREELYLCDRCASSRSAASTGTHTLWNDMLDAILPGPSLFGFPFTEERGGRRSAGIVCPVCGEAEEELRKTGLLGCLHCYEAFSSLLKPVFQQAHGHTRHVGKAARPDGAEADGGDRSPENGGAFRFIHAGDSEKPRPARPRSVGKSGAGEPPGRDFSGGPGKDSGAEEERPLSNDCASRTAHLRSELAEAVKKEDYERAAALRDAIRALEQKQSNPVQGAHANMEKNQVDPGHGTREGTEKNQCDPGQETQEVTEQNQSDAGQGTREGTEKNQCDPGQGMQENAEGGGGQ